jgi:hypothetical protein
LPAPGSTPGRSEAGRLGIDGQNADQLRGRQDGPTGDLRDRIGDNRANDDRRSGDDRRFSDDRRSDDNRDRQRDGDRDRGDRDHADRDRGDRDHDHGDRNDFRFRRYFFRPGLGWWFWRWNPLQNRYYQYYDRSYYGGYSNAYPSYAYGEPPVVAEPAALGVTFNQNLSGGAYIAAVVPGSPADQAGLAPGDVIVAINGGSVNGYQEVLGLVGQSRIGDGMQIDFLRGGQQMKVDVVLGPRSQVFQ